MKSREIEIWTLQVIDTVKRGHRIEDSRVELKRNWPDDASAAARRIGGHANAARGEPIIWLLGVDQETGVVGVSPRDTADWYAGVQRWFDGVSPPVADVVLDVEGLAVVALQFDTDRAPFTVRNPVFGQPGGGPVEREVPWRETTAVRSATRLDLLKLLQPTQRLPEIEILSAEIIAGEVIEQTNLEKMIEVRLKVEMYAVPPQASRIVIPVHRCKASVQIAGFLEEPAELTPSLNFQVGRPTWDRESWSTPNELVLGTPGLVIFRAFRDESLRPFDNTKEALVTFQIAPVGAVSVLSFELKLAPAGDSEERSRWVMSPVSGERPK